MADVENYIKNLKEKITNRDPDQSEFQEAVFTVLDSLKPVLKKHPEYIKANILGLMVEPERVIQFRIPWQDDTGNFQVN